MVYPMFSPSLRLMLALIVFLIATTCRAGTYIDGAGATLSSATNNNQLLINIQDTALGINMNYGYSGFVNWTQNNGSNTFTTFCIELNQDVYFGTTYNFTVTSVQNAPPLSSATNNNQLLINIQDTALGINMNYGYSGFMLIPSA